MIYLAGVLLILAIVGWAAFWCAEDKIADHEKTITRLKADNTRLTNNNKSLARGLAHLRRITTRHAPARRRSCW